MSVRLDMSTSDMSDTLTIVLVGADFDVRDRISGKILDYDLAGYEVKSVSQTGIRTTITCRQNERLFGKGILYYGDLDKKTQKVASKTSASGFRHTYQWLSDGLHIHYDYDGGGNGYEPKTADTTLKKEMAKLGVSYVGNDYDIISPIEGSSGTRSSLVSSLISWSKNVPDIMILAHIHGDRIYCRQRGFEESVTDISKLRYPVPTVRREESSAYAMGARVYSYEKAKYKIGLTFDSEVFSKEDKRVTSYRTGGTSNALGYDKSGRPLSVKTVNPDGSGEEVTYDYSDGDVEQIHEQHRRWDAAHSYEEKWDVYHTNIGHSQAIASRVSSGDDGESPEAESTFTTNRLKDMFPVTAQINITPYLKDTDAQNLYHIERIDSQGNYLAYDASTAEESLPFPFEAEETFAMIRHMQECQLVTTVTLDIISPVRRGRADYAHILTHEERIKLKGTEYFLESSSVSITTTEFKQSLTLKKYGRI